jgi:hypothetical protein
VIALAIPITPQMPHIVELGRRSSVSAANTGAVYSDLVSVSPRSSDGL